MIPKRVKQFYINVLKLNDNSYELVSEGKRGNDIVLTIDIELQKYVDDLNRKKHGELTKFGKKIATVIASGADYTKISEDFSTEQAKFVNSHFKI